MAKFRRQHVIGRFIVDFYAAAYRLVVEIDGAIHHDAHRDACLLTTYRVLRIQAHVVEQNLPLALDMIRAALRSS